MHAATMPPALDRDFLLWLAERLVHVYRLPPDHPAVDRLLCIAHAMQWNAQTSGDDQDGTGSLDSAPDAQFLHGLGKHITQRFNEPADVDFLRRLRAIANALPVNQVTN